MNDSDTDFDAATARYDAWYDTPRGRVLFENELEALWLLWRDTFRPALEIGVGTGRFAQALRIETGVDPAAGALEYARRRGIRCTLATGEVLPFPDRAFRGVALITALGFMNNPTAVLAEAARVLQPDGRLLLAEIPENSV